MSDLSGVPQSEQETRQPSGAVASDLTPDPLKMLVIKPAVIEVLQTIFDPEIPVNIYELGLIYDIIVDASAVVAIKMTLTAPACPAAQTLPVEVEQRVRGVDGVSDVRVEIVWDPPWDKDRMSDVAKLALGIF